MEEKYHMKRKEKETSERALGFLRLMEIVSVPLSDLPVLAVQWEEFCGLCECSYTIAYQTISLTL